MAIIALDGLALFLGYAVLLVSAVLVSVMLLAFGRRVAEGWRTRRAHKQAEEQESAERSRRWREGYEALLKGHELYQNKRYEEAVKQYDLAIERGSDDGNALVNRAFGLQATDWHMDAIDDFTRAITLEPQDSNLYFGRAMSKSSVGDLEGSVADMREAIRVAGTPSALHREYDDEARKQGYSSVVDLYKMRLMVQEEFLEAERDDERLRRECPTLNEIGPGLTAQRRASARRRSRVADPDSTT